jgi:hypothetical protein
LSHQSGIFPNFVFIGCITNSYHITILTVSFQALHWLVITCPVVWWIM